MENCVKNSLTEKSSFITELLSKSPTFSKKIAKFEKINSEIEKLSDSYKNSNTIKLEKIDDSLFNAYKNEFKIVEEKAKNIKEKIEKQIEMVKNDKGMQILEMTLLWFKKQAAKLAGYISYQNGCLNYLRKFIEQLYEQINDLQKLLLDEVNRVKELEFISGDYIGTKNSSYNTTFNKSSKSQKLISPPSEKSAKLPTNYPKICGIVKYLLIDKAPNYMITESVVNYYKDCKLRNDFLINSYKQNLNNLYSKPEYVLENPKNPNTSKYMTIFTECIEKVKQKNIIKSMSSQKMPYKKNNGRSYSVGHSHESSYCEQDYKNMNIGEKKINKLSKISSAEKCEILCDFIQNPIIYKKLLQIISNQYNKITIPVQNRAHTNLTTPPKCIFFLLSTKK